MDADGIIIGGGVVGSSIAYHLLTDGFTGRVVVVERDPTYARASSNLAMGGIRQQFSSALNIQLAQYSIDFYTDFDHRFSLKGSAAASFQQRGYLFLVDTKGRERFEARLKEQHALGAHVSRLSVAELEHLVPGMTVEDLEFGVLGPNDGYANPKAVLAGFREGAKTVGAEFITGEVTAIHREGNRVYGVEIERKDNINAAVVVNAAGPYAARVAELAGVTIPVQPVRQHLFRAFLRTPTSKRYPMIVDPSGVHWRHDDPQHIDEQDRFIVARTKLDEPPGENFVCDMSRWEQDFFPALQRRLPDHSDYTHVEGWSGLYEMTPDHNPVFGSVPDRSGFLLANGFSGHGLMMAPATGKALSELIRLNRYETFDLTPLHVTRFNKNRLFRDDATL